MNDIKLEKSIEIAAAPDRVFDFLRDPGNFPRLLPKLEISRVPALPLAEGAEFDYAFPLAGVTVHGTWTVTKLKAPSVYGARTKGLSESRWTMHLSPTATGTLFRLLIEYSIPDGLVRQAVAETIAGSIEAYLEGMLENLKKSMETSQTDS